jgi:site-specific DNA-methyltransferase (adenine-specific)
MKLELNKLICGNNVDVLKTFPDNCVDLCLTSPPYDDLRAYKGKVSDKDYNGYSFPFEPLAKELYRVIKQGGVIVWIINDGTDKNGSKTGSSFKQALYFKEVGFNIHDIMFYEKNGCSFPSKNRYYQTIEYMMVFSKGKPKTVRLIDDRKNLWAGFTSWGNQTNRGQGDDLTVVGKSPVTPDYGVRFQLWRYNTGKGFTTNDEIAFKHPAIYPEALARDHIISWSNVGDVVLDPFIGSGTTAKMALLHRRCYFGIDVNQEYVDLANERLSHYQTESFMEDQYSDSAFINSLRNKQKEKEISKNIDIHNEESSSLSDLF